MKLQVNDSGAWRNVCEFAAEHGEEVRRTLAKLAPLVNADWCIVDEAGRREWFNGGCSLVRAARKSKQRSTP